MSETLWIFMITYWYIIVPVITLMFLVSTVIVYRKEVRYWLMTVRLHFPIFGRIRYWVKHPGGKDPTSGFLASEKDLCSFYYNYYAEHDVTTDFFKKCQDYLAKINEDGRKEKGLGIWALIIILMVIEATAFGYALAPFALTLATPDTALAGAFAIGLVISIIGLILSEFSGRALYKNGVVGHILSFEEIRSRGSAGDMVKKDIINIDNTYDDNQRPEYQQMLNRVKVPKDGAMPARRHGVTIAYGIFIIGLAVAAFWIRTETLNAQEDELVANPPMVSQSTDDFPLTDDMAAVGESAEGKSAQDQIDALHRASLVTFAVLSGLFIFIQASSTYMAFIYGFSGTKSRDAWEHTHNFANADEFKRYNDSKARSIAVDAQSSLATLQAAQHRVFRVSGQDKEDVEKDRLTRTFDNYVHLKDKENINELVQAHAQEIQDHAQEMLNKVRSASAEGDTDLVKRLLLGAAPTFAQIDSSDTTLSGVLKKEYEAMQQMFSGTITLAKPEISATPLSTITPMAPSSSSPAAPGSTGNFDRNAWGDLTDFHDDDLPHVASKHGVELAMLKRARKLQLLDKGEV